MEQLWPRPTDADGAAFFEAAETGRAGMCVSDEAELRAVGFRPQPRGAGIPEFPQAMAPFDDPVIVEAGRRLVARGLATADPTEASAVTARGPMLAWVTGAVLVGHKTFNAAQLADPAGDVIALRRRVNLMGMVAGEPMTMVEYTEVPADAGAAPLPVRIEAVRLQELVDELVDAAFATPPAAGTTRTIDLFSMTSHGPARLGLDADNAVLLTHGHGLRHKSSRSTRADREVFKGYVLEMIGEVARA